MKTKASIVYQLRHEGESGMGTHEIVRSKKVFLKREDAVAYIPEWIEVLANPRHPLNFTDLTPEDIAITELELIETL